METLKTVLLFDEHGVKVHTFRRADSDDSLTCRKTGDADSRLMGGRSAVKSVFLLS
jgi:hypothetical protein